MCYYETEGRLVEIMKTPLQHVEKMFADAKMARENGAFALAGNGIRQIAEDLAKFYVEHTVSRKNYDYVFNHALSKKKSNLVKYTIALRNEMSVWNDGFSKELVLFLDLAREYGNKGSHTGKEPEPYEIDFLLHYFETHIFSHFIKDCDTIMEHGDIIVDVTHKYKDKNVSLRSVVANKYASAREDRNRTPICCDISQRAEWETYHVIIDNAGWASFKASNGLYLCVDLDEDENCPMLRAVAKEPSTWEQFKIFKKDGNYYLNARCNEKWVSCQMEWDDKNLTASSDFADYWEEFDLKIIRN